MKKPQLATNLSENLEKLNVNREKASKLFADVIEKAVKKSKPDTTALLEKDLDIETALDNQLANEPAPLKITVLGGGSFGTAMANLSSKNGCEVTLWVRDKRSVKSMQKTHINKKYLPDHKLDERLQFTHDLQAAVKGKDLIFVAVPSSAFRETLQKIAPFISAQAIVSLTKGMEKDTFALMSDVIADELPNVAFGVMSGPNLAKEIMNNMPSATVIASQSAALRLAVQKRCTVRFFACLPVMI